MTSFLLRGAGALARQVRTHFGLEGGGRPPFLTFQRLQHLRTSVSEAESVSSSASRRIGQILHLQATTDVGTSVDSYGKSSNIVFFDVTGVLDSQESVAEWHGYGRDNRGWKGQPS